MYRIILARLIIITTLVGIILLEISGCCNNNVLTPRKCERMNWENYGYQHGSRAIKSDLKSEITECSAYGVRVDFAAYNDGWKDGYRKYCTPEFGYWLGEQGKRYSKLCSNDEYPSYYSSWRKGIKNYCTCKTAYKKGKAGKEFMEQCPKDNLNDYENLRAAYERGQKIYQRKKELYIDLEKNSEKIRFKQNQYCMFSQSEQCQMANCVALEIKHLERERQQIEQHLHTLESLD